VTPGATVEAGGVALAYDDSGAAGAPVVLVHGTATARTVWREVTEALSAAGERDRAARVVAYDRRAYGDSGAPEPYGGTTVGEQADDLAALMTGLDASPATVCGHELGALACLDLAVRRPELVERLVLIEPAMLWLVADGTDAVGELREAVASAAREGGPGAAVRAYLEATGGPDIERLLGPERMGAAERSPRAFAADLAAAASWAGGRRELRALDSIPVTIVAGARSSVVRREAADALAALIPGAELMTLDSGHFAHLEQPAEVAAAILGGGV
jgi:pimeloyl-ACP methyl ester carboxylesterase